MKKSEKKQVRSELLEKARRTGRPKGTVVNVITLDTNGKNRGHIIPIGDIHLGAPTCNVKKLEETIAYALANKCHVIGMGDMLEAATRYSVGSGVYEQVMSVQDQVDTIVEMFTPLAKAGLLSGMTGGNHEDRISKAVGLDITKIMCRLLDIRNFGYGQSHIVRCGKESYTMWSHHGKSGARLPYTKIKACLDAARFRNEEVILMC